MSERITDERGGRFPSRGTTARLVPFLFGVTRVTQLSGPILVRLLGDLGIGEAAARAAIARMRVDGDLVATRQGRQVAYQLHGEMARGFQRVRAGAGAASPWEGHFHTLIYQVPESHRAYRDQLRRTALLSGFGLLTPGVLISLTDGFDRLSTVLDRAPTGAVLYRGQLALSENDAAAAAAHAWDLAALDRRYAAHLNTLAAALVAHDRPVGAAALRHYAELLSPVLVDTLRAPALPPALQPAAWCLRSLRDALGAVGVEYFPAVAAYLTDVLRDDNAR